jgi:hypothetical protein
MKSLQANIENETHNKLWDAFKAQKKTGFKYMEQFVDHLINISLDKNYNFNVFDAITSESKKEE